MVLGGEENQVTVLYVFIKQSGINEYSMFMPCNRKELRVVTKM